jgi:hypothetical protein
VFVRRRNSEWSKKLCHVPLGTMIVMEGLMLVPPERGTIIGRAVWKVSLRSDEFVFGGLTILSLDMSSSGQGQH